MGVARSENEFVGCVGFWRINSNTCELKRLYVIPRARGPQLGEQLIRAVYDRARDMRYTIILLDTIDTMTTAIRLYHRMGFMDTSAYRYYPLDGARYFSKRLCIFT